jgi:hypothetical protein
MDREYKEVLQDVLALDRESQITIAETVMSAVSATPEHNAAWRAETRKRTEAYKHGDVPLTDSDDVMARARKRIDEARRRA